MAHFAKILAGTVVDVIVAEPAFFETFIDTSPGEWVQVSYNTRGGIHYDPSTGMPSEDQTKAMRFNYPAMGDLYDKDADAFYSQQPFPSWSLNTTTFLWEPPVPCPIDGYEYDWNERDGSWQIRTSS